MGSYYPLFFGSHFDGRINCNSLLNRVTDEIGDDAKLLFDGKNLHWIQGGNSKSWKAYSGSMNLNRFDSEAQKLKNQGPIPEGHYTIYQKNYREFSETLDYLHRRNKNTYWGNRDAWGYQRVSIAPDPATNTYGRGGFFVHGGVTPGSAGCIDLVENMEDFAKHFLKYGKSIKLEVRYGNIMPDSGDKLDF